MEETIFVAVGIFDRYIKAIGPENLDFDNMIPLATVCTLMSAKLSEPISPSFKRMIGLLTPEEKEYVNKELLIELEFDVISKLEFNL